MLIGFGMIGLIVAWRHHHVGVSSFVFWGIGMLLAICASIPALGKAAYLAVYIPSSIIGFFVSHILLTAIFFLVFTPLGLLLRATGKDLLNLRSANGESHWTQRTFPRDPDSYYRQF